MLRKTKGGKKHEDENDSFDFMNIILMLVIFALGIAAGHFVLPMLLGAEDTSNSMMDTVKSLTSSVTAPAAPATASQLGGKKAFKNKYR